MGTTEIEGQRLSESCMPELGTYGSKGARSDVALNVPMKRNYNFGIGILRVVMTFEVILIHFWNVDAVGILLPFWKLKACAVPTFMLLSFYLTANRIVHTELETLRCRIIRLAIPFVVWGGVNWCVMMCADYVFKVNWVAGFRSLFFQLITGHGYHVNAPLWYMASLIWLTILYSLVFKIFRYRTALIVSHFLLIGSLVLQYSGINYKLFSDLSFELKYPLGRFVEMIPYATLGIDLSFIKIPVDKAKRKIIFFCLFFALILIPLSWNLPVPSGFSYQGVYLIIMAIILLGTAMFFPGNQLFEAGKNSQKINIYIYKMLQHTLGIYCMHYLVGNIIILVLESVGYEPDGFVLSICIYIICYLASAMISKIPIKQLRQLVD